MIDVMICISITVMVILVLAKLRGIGDNTGYEEYKRENGYDD